MIKPKTKKKKVMRIVSPFKLVFLVYYFLCGISVDNKSCMSDDDIEMCWTFDRMREWGGTKRRESEREKER